MIQKTYRGGQRETFTKHFIALVSLTNGHDMPASEGGDKGIFEEGCVWMQQQVITSMYKKYHIERTPLCFLQ